jgi:hypothetical protein
MDIAVIEEKSIYTGVWEPVAYIGTNRTGGDLDTNPCCYYRIRYIIPKCDQCKKFEFHHMTCKCGNTIDE